MDSGISASAVTSVIVVCAESDRSAEYRRLLPAQRYHLRWYRGGDEVLDNAEIPDDAVVIVDAELSDMPGIDFIRAARDQGIKNPVLMTVQQVSIPEAVKAIRVGADNILTLPLDKIKLTQAIKLARFEPETPRAAALARN